MGWRGDDWGKLTDDLLYRGLKDMDPSGQVRKLVFIDSCHSGGFWGNNNPDDEGDLEKLKNIALLAPAKEDCKIPMVTYECITFYDENGHSLFGLALHDALLLENGHIKGDKNPIDGVLQAQELMDYHHEYNLTRKGTVYEAKYGDPVEFSADLLNSEYNKSDDYTRELDYGGIVLSTGWNLISFPLQATDMSVAKILSDISNNCTIVWEFTPPSTWKSYDPKDPEFSELKNFTNDKGYWIKMNAEKVLAVPGADPSKTINLASGWNLIGYPGTSETAVGTALQSIASKYTIVWEFTPPSTWKSYDPNDPEFSELKTFISGKGYWIKMNAETAWTP